MIYQVGKKHCLNSGQNQNDYINPLESDLIVQPHCPLEFPGPLAPLPPGISKRGGVWIFSVPTQSVTKLADSLDTLPLIKGLSDVMQD